MCLATHTLLHYSTHSLIMEDVRQFLGQCRLSNRLDVLMPHLEGLGVTCLEDLLDVEKEDMRGLGEDITSWPGLFLCNIC